MNPVEPKSISLRDARALQTFVAPVDACPIALSILWMPVPGLPRESKEGVTADLCEAILTDRRFSHDPKNAIQYLLGEIIGSEQRLNAVLLKTIEQSLIERQWLNTYNTFLRSMRFSISGQHLLDTPVVITRSPPTEELLGKVISTGTVGLGMYAGLTIIPAEASPFLMLACVSGGIICISTAAGIGRALQDGIYGRILRIFGASSDSEGKDK